jgi:predicted dehydrogenase
VERRDLLKAAVLGGLVSPTRVAEGGSQSAASQPAAPRRPASDRIRIGMIGVGNFGTLNLQQFMSHADVDIAAICDASESAMTRAVALTGGRAKAFGDYRRLLEARDIDAVVITTPEHWHGIMGIDACDAGKDVYVEKPAAMHIREGRLMVDAARRNGRVVQVGTQQRSGAHFKRAVRYVQEGRIGEVHYATCWHHSHPSTPPTRVTGGPPTGLNWDLWLGPAPEMSYDDVWSGGRRSSWSLWGGMITEWGSHLTDIVLWALKAEAPRTATAVGARFASTPGEIPDVLQASYTFPGFVFHYSILGYNTYGLNGDAGAARFGSFGMQFHGTKGTLFVDRSGFRLTPQPRRVLEDHQPPSAGSPDSRQPGFYYPTDVLPEHAETSEQHGPHVRNFLDCVKSRNRPVADIEEGHRTNVVNRLGNIAYRVGRQLTWDGAREQVVGDADANRLVKGAYRAPWVPRGL